MVQYDAPLNATDASFEQVVLKSPLPTVAILWSPQETSRQTLNDVLTQTARDYVGEVQLVKLDVTDAPQTQARFDVDTLPQFLFFRQGRLIARARGLPSAQTLRPWVEYLLERGPMPASSRRPQQETKPGGGHPLVVTDRDFEAIVLGAQGPVLVDFWAAWCGPCRMVAPLVEQLAQEFAGRAVVAKLDVDANQMTAQRYGVQSIPTLILFRDGQEIDRVVGAQPIHVLRQKLEQAV